MGRRTGRENKMPGKRPNDNTYELFESKIIMNWLNSVLQRTVVWFLWENCISVKQRQWDLANAIWQSSLLWAWATRPASANGVYTDVTLPRWAEAWMGRSGLAQVSLLMHASAGAAWVSGWEDLGNRALPSWCRLNRAERNCSWLSQPQIISSCLPLQVVEFWGLFSAMPKLIILILSRILIS